MQAMFDLFAAECRRFRWWALGLGVIHAGVLLFFDRVVDPLQQPIVLYRVVGAAYAVGGVLLGLYQGSSYARINQWVALLHRPLAPRRVAAAVAGGGAAMLAATVALPLVLLLASHGLIGGRFVDSRHLWLALAGVLIALIGFLAGWYAALAPRRYGWLVLVPALAPALTMAVGWAVLVVQALTIVALALLLGTVFKPDLATPPRRAAGLGGTALAAAMGAYLVIVVAGDLVFQTLWIATGTHPLNATPPRGGVVEATRADGAALIEAGLAGLTGVQPQTWREQVRMSEVFAAPLTRKWLPVRGELTNIMPLEFDDRRRGLRWTFSHDDMRFHGIRLTDRAAVGTLDLPGGFASPPLPVDGGRLIAGNGISAFDADDGHLHRRITLPAGETVVAEPGVAGDAIVVLSDRALRFYDPRVFDDGDRAYPALVTVPLPAPVGGLMRADMIDLLDGQLIAFTYARNGVDGPAAAWQSIVVTDAAGHSRTVARRVLTPDFPLASRFADYWVSPVLRVVRERLEAAGGGHPANAVTAPVQVPPVIWWSAALIALASAGVAAWLAWRRRLGRAASTAWTAATLVLGLPMLIAFWLIRPVRPH